MDKRMVLYRGNLKSCNYHCSYCPFSKRPVSKQELEKDKEQWFSFLSSYSKKAALLNIGALMVVPYGEAMIYPWYWEGLAYLSKLSQTDAVGIQTNLSFSISKFLDSYQKAGGILEKLRIWATFHPEMTTVLEFAEKCKKLQKERVLLCAGSVGVPENLEILCQLKEELKLKKEKEKDIYLWINKMDGLKRAYTKEEIEAFTEIDPYFKRELLSIPADITKCKERLFIEANGKLHTCNISPIVEEKWEELKEIFPEPKCKRKVCSCYLAYAGRKNVMNKILFGAYPLFRIPRRLKAVFFKEKIFWNNQNLEKDYIVDLEALVKDGTKLFWITDLPYSEIKKRYKKIDSFFAGGIFAAGAYIKLEDSFYNKQWKKEEIGEIKEIINKAILNKNEIQYKIENNCLQIISANAKKTDGVKKLCDWLSLSQKEIIFVEEEI